MYSSAGPGGDNNNVNNSRVNLSQQQNSALAVPPPLPPRPVSISSVGNPGFYNTYPPGGYGNSMMYGGFSSPYGRYGFGGMSPYYQQESNLVRMAEEGSRPAFQSVESVVQAFTSISMMLESSYNAIYSSFRAVLGVVDQFSRLKAHLTHIITTAAVIKFLQWLYRRILVFLRLKPANYANSPELAWSAAQEMNQLDGVSKASGRGWSALMYITVIIGGPVLIWKMLSKIAQHVESSRKWAKGEGDHFQAKVLFTFNGVEEQELSVEAGAVIRVAPKELQPAMRGWLMASTMDGDKIGLVPMNYIEIIGRKNEPVQNAVSEAEFHLETAYRNSQNKLP